MLGDLNPQTIKIDQQAVVYPGRDHVTTLTIKRFDGRSYRPVDTSALTRVVLVFPDTDPTIAYDSDTLPVVFDWTGRTITIDLSDYAMPASSLPCYLIAFDAEHPAGQVLVDNEDTTLEFDFRNVSTTGTTPAPAIEFVTEAPIDGETYGRKNGAWVTLDAIVSGVVSVNGQTGAVVLDAADVGADPAGEAAAAVAAHVGEADPHTQYMTQAESDARYERGLVAGTNITIDRTNPAAPVISASGGGGGAVDSVNGQTGTVVLDADDIAEGATNHYYPAADESKLAGIESGAQVNVATDIAQSTRTATTVLITSSTGVDATLTAASTTEAGLQTAADKTKLDGVATGATANDTDANLKDRANHTGSQAISTVTGLQTALDGKATNPMTAAGDLIVGGASGAPTRLALGAPLQMPRVNAAGTGIEYAAPPSGGGSLPVVRAITANETIGLAQINTFGVNSTTNNYTATVPPQSSVTWTADAEIHFLPSNTGDITITGGAGVSLNGVVAGSVTLSVQNGAASIKRLAADSWWIGGAVGGTGGVVGPASAANNGVALFDGTTGKLIKDGGVLGSAAFDDSGDFATAAQGALADSATQPGDLATVATTGAYSDLSGLPTLGTAAEAATTDFATAAQGALADTALQPAAIGVTVQGYDADTAKIDVAQAWTASQNFGKGTSAASLAVPASALDLALGNGFTKTISGATTFTLSNVPASPALVIWLLEITNGGSATVTWWSGITWAEGSPPALTAAGLDLIGFYTLDGGTTSVGFVIGMDV